MCLLQDPPPIGNSSELDFAPAGITDVPPFTVRSATAKDADDIDALIAESYGALLTPVYHNDVLSRALPRLLRTPPSLLAGGSYFVADAGGLLLGAGGWSQATPFGGVGPACNGHMRRVAVRPDFIRSGIGALIVDHTLDHAREQGVKNMHCLSTLAAEDFYAAQGFKATGEVELTLEPGLYLPAIQMGRALH
ncbi:GNAT family acetyltransferase [Pacificibacter maritimus]|uniref:GNAT family acetyltransferase n=1 Tax=Pacificibacter maritimus TaxID=762213 RepID=A0A3N4UWZ6_9RHOB|nr:GNAT family N-acetyltransferase [Pacificibacter maritimus]RPE72069.1 GNAT family acetyltransferase [Pacificibacter maritimus]